jgi:hypothetical protein
MTIFDFNRAPVTHTPLQDTLVSDYEASPHPNAGTTSNNDDNPQPEEDLEESEVFDWEKLAEHEPTRKDLQIFNAAQQRKRAADVRFAYAMDECHKKLQVCITDFLKTVGAIYSLQSDELDAIESDIKQHLVSNDELRAKMQTRLEESANAAQGLFQQLLQRVAMPLQNMTNSISGVQSNGGGGGGGGSTMDAPDAARSDGANE